MDKPKTKQDVFFATKRWVQTHIESRQKELELDLHDPDISDEEADETHAMISELESVRDFIRNAMLWNTDWD